MSDTVSRLNRVAAIASAAVALVAVGWALTSGSGEPATETVQARPLRVTLASSDPEGVRIVDGPIAISPDGNDVVFTGSVGGQRRLYRRSLADARLRAVSGAGEIASAPDIAFSPDGRSVAYTAYVDARHSLRRASIDGGRSLELARLPQYPFGLSWSDAYGVVMGMFSWTELRGTYRVELTDTTVRTVMEMGPEDDMQHGPWVLEGGESALYLDYSGGPDLARVSLATGERELFEIRDATFRGDVSTVGIADGVLLYIDASGALMAIGWNAELERPVGGPFPVPGVPGGMREAAMASDGSLAMLVGPEAYELLLVDDRGNPELVLSSERARQAAARFSRDGSRIAITSDLGGVSELRVYDVRTGSMSQLSMGFVPAALAWSNDGARILATSGFRRSQIGDLGFRVVDGSEAAGTVLTTPGWHLLGFDLSRDGRMLAVAASQTRSPFDPLDVVVRDLDGDTTFAPFAAGASNELAPRFSPDGRWLAYASDETGMFQVYVRPFPGAGARVQVSDGGGGQPVWSADGRRLFHMTEDGIVAADVEVDAAGSLSVTSRERLIPGDFFGGPGAPTATYDVSPNGRSFVVARAVGGGGTEIVLWRDWLDAVKDLLEVRP